VPLLVNSNLFGLFQGKKKTHFLSKNNKIIERERLEMD
jgi:hypothetical protein